jgi:hypothetical protein
MQKKRKYTLEIRANKIVDSSKTVNRSKAIKIVKLTHQFLYSKNRHKKKLAQIKQDLQRSSHKTINNQPIKEVKQTIRKKSCSRKPTQRFMPKIYLISCCKRMSKERS